ncbi:MAG TPA: 50S ribosomal protein L6 [Thermodesulfobacteriota bacterium]|nr:50S ribosomal protein L6 [Thermodesulfobacteriota bacterium]
MSRIGRLPVPLPPGVTARVDGERVEIQGPKGTLARSVPDRLTVALEDGKLVVRRRDDERESKALHGLTRTLLANMVAGVTKGFEKVLEISGVGYRAEVQGSTLVLNVGFSHPVRFPLPKGITARVERNTIVTIQGIDKELVGQVAAAIRAIRRPDPYKAKGIRYANERIRQKVGKAGAK